MTPRQRVAVDMICTESVKKMILYEIKEPRDETSAARVTLKSGSAYDEFAIGVAGNVVHVGMSQSYNKGLAAVVQAIMRKAKKLQKEA